MEKAKLKKGVHPNLLAKCIGSDLEKQRLANKDNEFCKVEKVVIAQSGREEDYDEWLKSNKKNLKG